MQAQNMATELPVAQLVTQDREDILNPQYTAGVVSTLPAHEMNNLIPPQQDEHPRKRTRDER